MSRFLVTSAVLFFVFASQSFSDVFRNKDTGEELYGYVTQTQRRNTAKVFIQDEDGKFTSTFLNLGDYDISYDRRGRKEQVIVIPITVEQAFLSYRVCERISRTVVAASNQGPIYIILEIDSPGGRGDYAKMVTETVAETTNCPIITYVKGGTFGGIYSAATMVAVASDMVYFAPGTTMSSEPPLVGGIATEDEIREYLSRYSAESLSAYGGYAASLARQNGRPESLAIAMLDNTIDVVEVRTAGDGKSQFINRLDKLPSQQVVKNWSRTATEIIPPEAQSAQYQVQSVPPGLATATVPKVTSLTAQDAVTTGMADGLAASRTELLEKFDLGDIRIIENNSVIREVRNFAANQEAVNVLLANVDYLENRSQELRTRLESLRELNARGTVRRESYYDNLQDQPIDRGPFRDVRSRESRDREGLIVNYERYLAELASERRRQPQDRGEIVVESEFFQTEPLRAELAAVLDGLISNYNRLLRIARRYPGAMPLDVNTSELQRKAATAANLRQDVLFGY